MKVVYTLNVPTLAICAIATLALPGASNWMDRAPKPKLPYERPVGPPPVFLDDIVGVIAQRNGVEQRVVRSVIAAESEFNHDAVSSKGAVGLMQVMPATA